MSRPAPVDVASPGFARDRTTLVLYTALGVFGMLQVVPGLVTPALRDELGYGFALASLHVTAFAGAGVTAGLLAPRLDRRVGRRGVLLLGLLGMAAGAAALTAGRSPATTLAAAGLAGLLGTLVLVAVQSGLADHHGEHRAVAFAESNVVASVGSTTAPLVVGAAVAALGSWRWGVLALAGTAVLVALLVRRTPVPGPAAVDTADDASGALPGAARAGVALVFAAVTLEFCVGYWGATYLREQVGLAPSTAVTAMTLFFAAMLTGRIATGVLVRRVDPVRLVVVGLAVAAAGVAVQAASTAPVPALVGLVLLGLGVAGLFPLALALAVAAAPARTVEVSGRCVVAGSAAVLLGPLVVGQLADVVGLRSALGVLPLVLLGAGVVLRRVVVRRTPVSGAAPRRRS